MRITSLLLLLTCITSVSAWAGGEPGIPETVQPTPAALERVAGLKASRMAVDRRGNLWSWNQPSGDLQVLSPAGDLVASAKAGEALAVDYDPEWGLAWIDHSGRQLFIDPLDGGDGKIAIALDERVADLSWIADRRIAVSPVRASHRVEIWDLASRTRVATWGQEEPIPSRPGTVPLNTFLLEFDFRRELLYTLESFSGRIEVFDLKGDSVMAHQVPSRNREELEEWIRETDQQKRQQGEVNEIFIRQWPSFAVDPQGAIWLPERCQETGEEGDEQTLAGWRITLQGLGKQIGLDLGKTSCCSLTTTSWGDGWILYREPQQPQGACTETRRK